MSRRTRSGRILALLLAASLLPALLSPAAVPLEARAASAAASATDPGKTVLVSVSSPACNKVTISWKKTTGVSNYRIYYKEAGASKWQRVAVVSASQQKYTHTASRSFPITVGKDYVYTVRAYNAISNKYGVYDKKGLTVRTVPDKVNLKSAIWNSARSSVTVTWNASHGGTYYRIYRRTPSTATWKYLGSVRASQLKFVDKSPVKGEDNYYTVRFYNHNTKAISRSSGTRVTATTAKDAGMSQTSLLLKKTKTAAKTKQIILVVDHNLTFWEKASDGNWDRRLSAYCGYGSNGLSDDRHEGDRTTPIGSFPILHGFGIAANPGSTMQYKKVTSNSYWSGERSTYNQWVESARPIGGEHLIDYYQYKYAMAIGFNRNPTVYKKGSAIFLHCKSYDHWSTAGCVSVQESVMKQLLLLSRNGVYIIIVRNQNDLSSY